MTPEEQRAQLRALGDRFDELRAEEWRIFLEVTGYDPDDPTESDPRAVFTEAVEQIKARAIADANVPQLADAYAVAAHQRSVWFAENSAAQAALGRVRALADEWQAELDSGAIRDENARYCWGVAVRELRAALGDK